MLPEPTLRHVADFDIDLDPISEMGDGRSGKRRIIPIVGGRITGPEFDGEILNVGADWQTIFSSGVAELDTRYAFRTDDGAVIEIINFGYRHGPEDVMRRGALPERLEAGFTNINSHGPTAMDGLSPFGGVKQSGIGHNFGFEGIRQFQEVHSISGASGTIF